eukprot:9338131-Pyramimonas_sp.AAC.1
MANQLVSLSGKRFCEDFVKILCQIIKKWYKRETFPYHESEVEAQAGVSLTLRGLLPGTPRRGIARFARTDLKSGRAFQVALA